MLYNSLSPNEDIRQYAPAPELEKSLWEQAIKNNPNPKRWH